MVSHMDWYYTIYPASMDLRSILDRNLETLVRGKFINIIIKMMRNLSPREF